ncbi:MAG TPA: PQQ-binding-like beta-propeller repeat protein [Verrucomicrobiae bacterium]
MNFSRAVLRGAAALLCCTLALASFAAEQNGPARPLTLIVMDPLSRELNCVCVKGNGQRDYRKLSARLAAALKEKVNIEFSDDLADTLSLIGGNKGEYLIIGDRSIIAHAAEKAGLKCKPLCALSDRDGKTTLAATFLIRSDDPANELKDLGGRKLLFGFPEADEKVAAALASLKTAGVTAKPENHQSFNDAALDLLDSEASPLPVVVVPSYALSLLQGCGSVKPGNLKVLATTDGAPFITAFLSDHVAAEKREKILATLLETKNDAALLEAIESKEGFKPVATEDKKRADHDAWPDWRGPTRDGRVAQLPKTLPTSPTIVWKKGAVTGGLAGLSVSEDRLLVAERDLNDERDVYRCFNSEDGELIWRASFAVRGNLDYGNAPRAAPVLRDGRAYVLGAFGDLRCLDMDDGKVLWERQLIREFAARLPTWGTCSPPLIIDDLLIINPGGTNASLAALDLCTGHTRWTTPGAPAAYSAFVAGEFGGRRQFIGYDDYSLGGWDPATGKRLWRFVPPVNGDFNVPTPIAFNDGIVVSTENNGTRFYRFDRDGRIIPTPTAQFADLSPDTSTPVITNNRVFGADQERIYCLDTTTLKPIWELEEKNLGDHASLVADDERVLVSTIRGELILLDAKANASPVISRMKLFQEDVEVYAHPALVGSRLYARGGDALICVDLAVN